MHNEDDDTQSAQFLLDIIIYVVISIIYKFIS